MRNINIWNGTPLGYNKEYDDVNLPSLSERIYSQNQSGESEIRFFSQKLVGYREYNDFYSPVEDVYHYSYYEYTYSPLVSIINGLLNDSPMVIDKIFNPESIHRFNFDHEIDNINNEINKIPNNKIKEKMDKLNELNDLLKFANLNSKQKDEDEYYIKLQGLIKFELVSILPYEIKEKYESFYCRTLKKCK